MDLPAKPVKASQANNRYGISETVEAEAIPASVLRGMVEGALGTLVPKEELLALKVVEEEERRGMMLLLRGGGVSGGSRGGDAQSGSSTVDCGDPARAAAARSAQSVARWPAKRCRPLSLSHGALRVYGGLRVPRLRLHGARRNSRWDSRAGPCSRSARAAAGRTRAPGRDMRGDVRARTPAALVPDSHTVRTCTDARWRPRPSRGSARGASDLSWREGPLKRKRRAVLTDQQPQRKLHKTGAELSMGNLLQPATKHRKACQND